MTASKLNSCKRCLQRKLFKCVSLNFENDVLAAFEYSKLASNMEYQPS